MKRNILLFLLSSCFCVFSQVEMSVEFEHKITLKADRFVGVNMFDELFYVSNNTLFKQAETEVHSYKNVQLGQFYDVSIINTLQTSVFHKNFNAFVQLDKKLGVLTTFDFNTSLELSAITYASVTSNKRLWIFNNDTQQLQVYNPQHDTIEVSTTPIQEPITHFYSNYNFCWVLCDSKLLQFNIYGNLLNTYALNGYEDFAYYKGIIVLKKENSLYALSEEETLPVKINLPEIPIKEFSVTNETLYIYTGKELYSFTINLKQTE